jgi:hypothetical protein
MRFPARQILGSVAGLTAVVYLALVVLAAGCLFMHATPSGGHEHHSADPSHSPLCAWSCQAVSSLAVLTHPPMTLTAAVARMEAVPDSLTISHSVTTHIKSRAPPIPVLA